MDPQAWEVRKAQTRLAVLLDEFQEERDLTNIEMLQAVTMWQATVFKFMLRAERGDVDRPADLQHEED